MKRKGTLLAAAAVVAALVLSVLRLVSARPDQRQADPCLCSAVAAVQWACLPQVTMGERLRGALSF